MKKTILTLSSFILLVVLFVAFRPSDLKQFHSQEEKDAFELMMRASGPHGVNDLFGGSGLCSGCHGHDPNAIAFLTSWGEDVNVYDQWAGTMMANSSKDPFWRAKVSHEILVNPANAVAFETKCTSCHAPQGHFNAFHNGSTSYSISSMVADSIAMDGVGCGACHQQKDTLIGKRFSGELIYDTTKTVYGPFLSPFAGPMTSFIGFNVTYGAHVTKAGLCAGCHTLLTDVHDLSGIPTGAKFVEQATYHEWLNSSYNNEAFPSTGRSCQSCHMPRIDEDIVIAANYAFLAPRRPYGQHHLVGANSFMLNLIKNNASALGVTANPEHFDSSIVRTNRMMQDSAVQLNLNLVNRTSDTAFYELKLTNLAGHKFPSGYPSRRAFVQFVLMNAAGDTLFKNGMLNSSYQLVGQDPTFEPHHNYIKSENDVQIYEIVAGDVMGNVTTVLERASVALKDNRLTPKGFSTSHLSYDTTRIEGVGSDADFNYDGSTEGSGSDIVHFNIPLAGYAGDLNVVATLYYQSIPHKWLDEMFTHSSPEIDLFKGMYNAADHTPLLVAQIKQGDMFAGVPYVPPVVQVSLYPNPSLNGQFTIQSSQVANEVKVYSMQGTLVAHVYQTNSFTLQRRGTYIVRMRFGAKEVTQKIVFR